MSIKYILYLRIICVIVFFLNYKNNILRYYQRYPDCFSIVPVTCDSQFYSPDGPTVGRLGNLTKWRPAILIMSPLLLVLFIFSTVLIIIAGFDTVICIL